MLLFKQKTNGIRSLSNREVIINDVIDLCHRFIIELTLKNIKEETILSILRELPHQTSKPNFILAVHQLLAESHLPNNQIVSLLKSMKWIINREFRWSFDIFSMYQISVEELTDNTMNIAL